MKPLRYRGILNHVLMESTGQFSIVTVGEIKKHPPCGVLLMSSAIWVAISEYFTPIGKSFHHDGKHVPHISNAATARDVVGNNF